MDCVLCISHRALCQKNYVYLVCDLSSFSAKKCLKFILVCTKSGTGSEMFADAPFPVILYNDSLAAAVGSNRSMVEDGEMPNVASWYVNGAFLSAWYSAVDAEELPASAAAFVEMSRNAAFQSGTAAEGGAAMAAMG